MAKFLRITVNQLDRINWALSAVFQLGIDSSAYVA